MISQALLGAGSVPYITSNLIYHVDAALPASYPGTGQIWTDIIASRAGTMSGTAFTYSTAGGGSIPFNGTNNYFSYGRGVTNGGSGVELTYNVWFRTNSIGALQTLVWDDDNQGGGDSWFMINTNGTIGTQRESDGFRPLNTNYVVTANQWTNFTFVASATAPNKRFYINGVLDTSNNISINSRASRSDLSLGANFGVGFGIAAGGGFFNGNMSVVQIYTRALTAAEVFQNYQAFHTRHGI
jgi:hypothetical protein